MARRRTAMDIARDIFDNHFTLLFCFALVVGLLFRLLAEYPPLKADHAELAGICKEIGNFGLAAFLIAFVYENFINRKIRHEFRTDLEEVLHRTLRLGIHAVYDRRPTVAFKAGSLLNARKEVIELGTALNTFRGYLASNMSTDMAPRSPGYRQITEDRLKSGINITCLVLDPDFAALPGIAESQPALANKIRGSLNDLKRIEAEISAKGYPGTFQIMLYRSIPHFSAICTDGSDGSHGRILISPYLQGVPNADAPVFEVHSNENEQVFEVYYGAIKQIMATATPIR